MFYMAFVLWNDRTGRCASYSDLPHMKRAFLAWWNRSKILDAFRFVAFFFSIFACFIAARCRCTFFLYSSYNIERACSSGSKSLKSAMVSIWCSSMMDAAEVCVYVYIKLLVTALTVEMVCAARLRSEFELFNIQCATRQMQIKAFNQTL